MIRVVVVDDHPIMRQGVSRLLAGQTDIRVMRELSSGREVLKAIDQSEFDEIDVLVLDLSLPEVNGMEVLRQMRAKEPTVRVVVLSMYPANQYETELIAMGAHAYVSKDAGPDDLLRAVRAAASGERPKIVAATSQSEPRAPHKSFTAREYQVFTLIFQGRSVAEIASQLEISSATVSNHLAGIRTKLGVRTIGEIVRYALDAGLTGPRLHS